MPPHLPAVSAHPGQYNINIGTSGWIATVSPEPFTDKPGAANLAFGVEEGFVNAVPFLNAGDVHNGLPAYSPMAITQRRISLSKHPNLAPTVCYACHIWWGSDSP